MRRCFATAPLPRHRHGRFPHIGEALDFDRLIRFPGPAELDALEAENLARAGVKMRGALHRDAAHPAIRLQDAQFDLRPMRYRRAATWEGVRGAATVLSEDVDDATLGAAILEALATSRAVR